MTIQIMDVVLYSHRSERRVLSLEPGKMNIITGNSGTGKSALSSVVDYCLGSSKCGVPQGVIRRTVAWYALRLTDGSSQYFVARRAPLRTNQSSTDAHYVMGSQVALPDGGTLAATTTIVSVVERLSAVVGIRANLHEPPEGQSRNALSATLRHALTFAFQSQHEICHPAYLFHKQSDTFVARAISDTLPYFLGAVDDDFVAKKARLRDLTRLHRTRERELGRLEVIAGVGLGNAAALVSEARNVSLLSGAAPPETHDQAVAWLRQVAAEAPDAQLASYERRSDQAELNRLNEERVRLRALRTRQEHELQALRSLLEQESGFVREAGEQAARLSSIELFSGTDESHCPLCDQASPSGVARIDQMRRELRRTISQLEPVSRHTPGLQKLAVEQQAKVDSTRELLVENQAALEAVRRADARWVTLRDASTRRALVLGRVSLFLESLPQVTDSSTLRAEIDALHREITALSLELADEQTRTRLDSMLSIIGRQLTKWAERLVLEYGGDPFRLDVRKLQIVADAEAGPVPMDQMGSAANALGCHLIAHLSLHHWFVRRNRPVPAFLILDQPSQVYFPPDTDGDPLLDSLEDADRQAVIRFFELIQDVVSDLNGGLQVIVMEHADLKEDWYQGAVVERWRGGSALIPSDWDQSDG